MSIKTAENWHATKTLLRWAGRGYVCSEAVSDVVKTVKDHGATKTWLQWAVEHL